MRAATTALVPLLAVVVHAHSNFANLIPNGKNVVDASGKPWPAVGHVHHRPPTEAENIHIGGGFPRNPFGLDFARYGFKWSTSLCAKDSDGDGRTNGEELGDPHCWWVPGLEPERSHNITHPGYTPQQLFRMTGPGATMHKSATESVYVASETISLGRVYNSNIAWNLPYLYLPTGIFLGLLIKWFMGPRLPAIRWLLCWCLAEYLGVFGIGVAFHRYFTHQSFTANWLCKQLLFISGAMTLQGNHIHWAWMHRIHHRLCDQELDFHSPIASERGFWFAHATWMVTAKPHYQERGPIMNIVNDLSNDPDEEWMKSVKSEHVVYATFLVCSVLVTIWTLINVCRNYERPVKGGAYMHARSFLRTLCPELMRLPFYIWHFYALYYMLPVLGSWHGTMLINSATHWFGDMPHEDAMSAACEARNVPWLQWVLMGENWHNNHHAAPTSASTWVEWYQLDGVYIMIRCLELVGLATDVKVEVPALREGYTPSGWEFPLQISTQLLFFWLWWHFYLQYYWPFVRAEDHKMDKGGSGMPLKAAFEEEEAVPIKEVASDGEGGGQH